MGSKGRRITNYLKVKEGKEAENEYLKRGV